MRDIHYEMYTFYDEHVRLKKQQRDDLAGYRDHNIERLKAGLDSLGYPHPVRICTQGSIPMKTANQHPENDYDVDVALIFDKNDLPASPLDARKRVCNTMIEGGGNFKVPPEARTNAVTVWYQAGHHVDLAIHRRYFDTWENEVIEHGGVNWTERDPEKITNWFHQQVDDQSPLQSCGATVEPKQMRRVVQLLKKFAKGQSGGALPGGLIISVLVADRYVPDNHRDDSALYQTMCGIHSRLSVSLDVRNPVDSRHTLTYKEEYINQVKRFQEKLALAIEDLQPLHSGNCTQAEALGAWAKIFNHVYWDSLYEEEIATNHASGEAIWQAAQSGSLYVAPSGLVTVEKPSAPAYPVRPHRFYGES